MNIKMDYKSHEGSEECLINNEAIEEEYDDFYSELNISE